MTDFIVTITDPEQLAGITWAREQYNASIPPPSPPPEQTPEAMSADIPTTEVMSDMMPTPVQQQTPLDTDEAYVQHIMDQASISYVDQKLRAEYQAHYENATADAAASRAKRLEPKADDSKPERTVPRSNRRS